MTIPNLLELTGRKKDKFIQKVLDVKNLSEARKKKIKFPLLCSIKVDGVFCLAWKHSQGVTIYSRTGEVYTSMQHLEDALDKIMAVDDIILFEAFKPWPYLPQPTISGWARDTKNQHEELEAYCHDLLRIEDFLGTTESLTYEARKMALDTILIKKHKASKLHSALQYLYNSWDAIHKLAEIVWGRGEEGLVLRDPQASYHPGKRDEATLKVKQNVSYDLVCIGAEEGTGKYQNTVGALKFRFKNDSTVYVGTGMTDKERNAWWDGTDIIVGKVCEIAAMKESSKGVLREPAFKGIRHDKTEGDF